MIVNIHEAKTNLSKLIERFMEGEKIIIAKNGKPVLQFARVDETENQARPTGFLNCEVDMSRFDDPIEGTEDYQ
ncbi:MAG: hypothetical protein A2161_12650 [Candidatus Schekmanbacteria bacterium RBG_13_48_7]|uniref:Antitoxin n=1 Tax=Candidatus Schekmanbacteria bacterium RBG_13_48_7 TaxID=1817878 RepID=A0A1F7S3A5_9BACT|nr:MAG: hypothetical protein A2161_12650 [Candidatus Schekmanbacteria bacterium RBG_13_48_7]